MPEQPDDPIHYEMKIPPEPKDAQQKKEQGDPHEESGKDKDVKRDTERANQG